MTATKRRAEGRPGRAPLGTTGYSAAELEAMMADLESDLVERKESLRGDAPTRIREAVCAFANDLPDHGKPGVVFIGAGDSGVPVGLDVGDELLLQLSDIKTDGNVLPPPTLTVAARTLLGRRIAVVTVWPSDSPPVRYRGRIWTRTGPRRTVASPQDERVLNEKRRYRDSHFDTRPLPTAGLADLSLVRFDEEYLPNALEPEALAANERTTEERLAAAKMIVSVDDPVPTVAGVLVLGREPHEFLPGAYAQFLRVEGTEYGDPVADAEACRGPLARVVGRLDEKFAAHNRVAVDFLSGPVEIRRSTYPLDALGQLVRNAVMHRTYQDSTAPVHAYWFDDRVEIASPGGPYGALTADNFGDAGLVDYRNPNVAEAMRVLGLVQRFGFGIPAARRSLCEGGHPDLEFKVSASQVRCIVRAREETP
ncbi:MAG: putative DNA binding domain-containing protein [Acidobacteriota bacterium]|nr:putative DNA binding domain-containing protein [Acidobacteriota bacterium]